MVLRKPLVTPLFPRSFNAFSGEATMSDLFRLPLAEKYRPKSFEEVIGQPKLVAQVQGLKARGGLGGRAYWLSGRSGGGKSSTARLIARDLADELNIEVSDARGLSIETLK